MRIWDLLIILFEMTQTTAMIVFATVLIMRKK